MPASAETPRFLVCLAGPTGAGKTAAALALAEALPISVINADSRQVYADFPIITAQPSPEERARCPHLLYGFLSTDEKLGAGEYARLAAAAIAEEHEKGRLPILVGGTGLYFKTLLEGIAAIPDVPRPISAYWQTRCQAEGAPALHALLAEHDPAYAAKIHPHDRQRVTRALEVWQATGKSFSWWHARPLPVTPYDACKIGISLPMAELEILLGARIESMLRAGALEEARAALIRCPSPEAPGWTGIGCKEVHAHLEGSLTLDECRVLWRKNTRAYAKRQNTWFRADPAIRWFRPEQTEELVTHVLQERQRWEQRRQAKKPE